MSSAPVRPARRTQAERRAATRKALLDATIDVLVDRGYAGLTTTLVCERAGVTRGAQAHYFATKADLVVQALSHLTDALVAELKTGRLRAALDVTAPEPLPAGHPLLSAPGLLITPHIAGSTPASGRRMLRLMRSQLLRYLSGEQLNNVITDTY